MFRWAPTIRTTDLVPAASLAVGKARHIHLIDLVAAVEGPGDEEILKQMYSGRTQAEIAVVLGVHQTTVSRRIQRLMKRAR